ncbi:type I-E CRISPR-associated protein Cse2/CasB [Actinacidiphila bryophytorum]|uniref:type I-E CRISPR-associated protein Cse2/CasB n=1 Tax=Actinacidiphila bryophytorum TaxID=1436133 RepID=UPI002176DCC2|nr:type I-E CRISPR-associated protein Cse2/CasB [Actinacidiphila bryophytorum]UWE08711.1 type I-E CRISPR-associated protein Cse2/CasB [Actinacidiphila bryophytorum]
MTTETPPRSPSVTGLAQHKRFTPWVEQICRDDPGARTALRSGLRRGINDVPRMHRLVAAWLPRDGAPETEQRAYYTIAAMIAAQPRSRYAPAPEPVDQAEAAEPSGSTPAKTAQEPVADGAAAPLPQTTSAPQGRRYGDSLGTAFATAVTGGPGRERDMRESTAESRLNLLTRQSVNGLHRHLPSAVGYLRELDVPVDWAQLLDDLIAWPVHSGRISRRWLQDYYRLRAKAEQDKAATDDQIEIGNPETPA